MKIAQALLCSRTDPGKPLFSTAPCGKCPSCIKAATKNHPDIVHVTHAKPNVLTVGEIRDQVVSDILIKPYYGPNKIYIIQDAGLMNVNAQNALLKSIEEPPGYGMVFLLTDNAYKLLETIRSRCIIITLQDPSRKEQAEMLLDDDGKEILRVICGIAAMDAFEVNKSAKTFENLDRQKILDIMRLWFRDLLVYKYTGDLSRLYFEDRGSSISFGAGLSPEGINRIIQAIDVSEERLKANVKAEAAFENLLLAIRKEYRKMN